jgi:hypothetical protein
VNPGSVRIVVGDRASRKPRGVDAGMNAAIGTTTGRRSVLTTRLYRRIPAALGGLMVLLAATAANAQDASQTIDAGGLTFDAPAAWKSTTPESSMRRAQLEIKPVKGDEDSAKLVVFAFPGGAGSVDANVERWQKMFKDADGKLPKVEVKKVKGKNAEVTRVEIAGHYYPSNFPGQKKEPDRENYRLLGGIVLTDDSSYFLRMVGPEKTVSEAKAGFDKLLASIKTGK